MHQKDRLRQKNPESDFDSYYLKQYKETWEVLKSSLKEDKPLVNISEIIKEVSIKEPYYLDPASVQCALNLPVNKNSDILDMCAAPGGKALITALRLNGSGSLTLNDLSSNRIIRLKKVISEHLDTEVSSNISFSCKDATKIGIRTKNQYDCILLDAPCSSERHVINSPEELAKWSVKRPEIIFACQFSLLCSAYEAVKDRGFILYSTCSLNENENTGVIEKLIRRRKNHVRIIETEDTLIKSVRLKYGNIILPHIHNFAGPMYYCLLQIIKEEAEDEKRSQIGHNIM